MSYDLFSNCYQQNFLLVHGRHFHKDGIRRGKRQCFTWRELMAFRRFDLLSVRAKGLLKLSWLQSHQRAFWPTKLLSTCVLLKITVWCQQIEEANTSCWGAPCGFPTAGSWPWPEVINHLGATSSSKGIRKENPSSFLMNGCKCRSPWQGEDWQAQTQVELTSFPCASVASV